MKVFALTFAYNESFFLPRWVSYYGAQIGHENLFVLDHGSTDLSTDGLRGVNVIRVPREKYDEVQRIQFASSMHAALLHYYDAGFVMDCDEFIVADPRRYRNLSAFAAATDEPFLTCVGIDVYHCRAVEPPLDPSLNLLVQRRHGVFNSWMCKRSFASKPIRFGGGFHTSNKPVVFGDGLFLFHMKNFDYRHRLARQLVTMKWEYAGDWGKHARSPLETVEASFRRIDAKLEQKPLRENLDFSSEIALCLQKTELNGSGEYDFNIKGGFDSQDVIFIPDEYAGLF